MQGEDDLKSAIGVMQGAVNAAIAEIQSLVGQIIAGAGDPDADIEGLAQQLSTTAANLQNAVSTATTPPGPTGPTGATGATGSTGGATGATGSVSTGI